MRIFLAIILCLFLSITASQSQILSPKLLSTMETADPEGKIAVIIELSEQADLRPFMARSKSVRKMSALERKDHRSNLIRTLKSKADLSQGRILSFLRNNGIASPKALWINNSIAAEIIPEIIQQLSVMPEVANIRTDAIVSMPEVVPAATNGIEDNLHTVNVPALWNEIGLGNLGTGTVVALLDSGVDHLHPDLNLSWRGGSNSWFNPVAADCALDPSSCISCDFSELDPCDFVNSQGIAHGTGVAGIIVGGDAGGTSIGVAPQAQWIAAKIFKSDETATTSNIHLAFQWVLDPDGNAVTDDAPDVVNSSWGLQPSNTCIEEFRLDIQALKAAGIAAVFSSGNSGPLPSTDESPANYAESLAVGSVGTPLSSLEISDFSGRGPSSCGGSVYPEVVAPGFLIKSTDYTNGGNFPNSYIILEGTSFASPHVAGIMALLTQAFPQTPLVDIEDAIIFSAQDLGALGPDSDYGYGLIDALAAYDWLIQAPNIAVTDPVPPENDRSTIFGPVEPSVASQQTLLVGNSGRGELTLGSLVLTVDPVFSLPTDNCSTQVLTAGQSCSFVVEFLSSTVGTFSGNIAVPSNDFDEPTVNISLTGITETGANPPPRLVITDSVPPTGDLNLPFGLIIIGNSRSETLQVTNDDLGDLVLEALDVSALDASFTISTDTCSGQTLAFAENCIIGVDFTPTADGRVSGILGLSSNDPTTPISRITVSGEGNNLPPVPTLVSPAPGASNLSVPLNFSWLQLPDPDGDKVTSNLFISTDPSFTDVVPIQIVLHITGQSVLLANVGGLLLLTGLLARTRRKRSILRMLILAFALVILTSCGGGGSSINPNLRSHVVSNLSAQTTSYWKVTADDGNGGISESSVSNFSTE